jgi:hypothetical protein
MKSKWDDTYYVTIYEAARAGHNKAAIAGILGVQEFTLKNWGDKNPAVRDAWVRGKRAGGGEHRTAAARLQEYIFDRLPPEIQELWEKIEQARRLGSVRDAELLLREGGLRARQQLFLFVLTTSHFNPSAAMRETATSSKEYRRWIADDPTFAEMVNEIQYHKKNFFESKLVELVEDKEPAAVLFANRTLNRDRGYSDKQEIEHSGTVHHQMDLIDISKLNLSLACRQEILAALRAQVPAGTPAMGLLGPPPPVIDVESEHVVA